MVRKLLLCMVAFLIRMATCAAQDIKSLENSAKRGNSQAQCYLGIAYMNGTGVKANDKKAIK